MTSTAKERFLALVSQVWAIYEPALLALLDGSQRDEVPEAAARGAGQAGPAGVAVVALHGPLMPRDADAYWYGGTGLDAFVAKLQAAVAAPDVRAVVLDVDSPGGSVFGVEEAAAAVMAARGRKPIIAVANHMAASAAYWVASAADELVVSPSAMVGSVGVITVHVDDSKLMESIGYQTTVIAAGRFKGEMLGPLTDEAKAELQGQVDRYYEAFVRSVAKGRGVTAAKVRGDFGEGRVVGASAAVQAGMADRIGTLDSVLKKLGAGGSASLVRADKLSSAAAQALALRFGAR